MSKKWPSTFGFGMPDLHSGLFEVQTKMNRILLFDIKEAMLSWDLICYGNVNDLLRNYTGSRAPSRCCTNFPG